MYLEHISSPEDLRALPSSALPALCEEIRCAIIESSAADHGPAVDGSAMPWDM